MLKSFIRFLIDCHNEHNSINYYDFADYYTFETIEDLNEIVTSDELPEGVYVFDNHPDELLLKKYDSEGRILIGLSHELTSSDTLFIATNDGLTIKDNSRLVSKSLIEEFLVMHDTYGLTYNNFILVEVTCDEHINLINWYGQANEFVNTEPKKKRKYERKYKSE